MTYESVVLADTPLAYWQLNEAHGSPTVADSSGNGWTGTVNGGVTLGQAGVPAGMTGTYAAFDGATGFISTLFNPVALLGLTVECWIQLTGTPTDGARMIGQDEPFVANTGWNLAIGPGNNEQFFIEAANGFTFANTNGSAAIPLTGWHHLVGTWDGTTLRTYLDSVLDTNTAAFAGSLAQNGSAGQVIGAWTAGTAAWWAGPLAQMAVYSSALSQARITAHYNAGITPLPSTPGMLMAGIV